MKKLLLSLLSLFALISYVNAESYTHTFTKDDLTTAGGETTLSDYLWTSTPLEYVGSVNNTKGLQIGKAPKDGVEYHVKSFTLSTAAFAEYSINSITVNTSTAASSETTLTISVATASETFTITNSAADYTFNCNKALGDITITWSQPETTKAIYVKSITIDYALPAGEVNVAKPYFKTVPGTYPDEVTVEAETEDLNAILYYTIDGSEPSLEDYNAGGSTLRSGYYVMYKKITTTSTIKVIAVVEDGGQAYSSSVVEATYTIEPGVAYVATNKVSSGKSYGIFVGDSIANPAAEDKKFDYLNVTLATVGKGYLKSIDDNAFTMTEVDGGYTIQDVYGRYLYTGNDSYKNISFAEEKPANGAVWTIAFDENMNATIVNTFSLKTMYYSTSYGSFGCYASTDVKDDMLLPRLYLMGQFPEYTITPAANEEVESFQKVRITSPTGIKYVEGLVVNYNYQKDMTVTQVDDNTLEISLDAPVTTKDNQTIFVYFTGSIMLDPNGLNIPLEIAKNRLMYTIVGETAPATVKSVTPADNSKVESLSYFLFAFTKICVKTDNTEIFPRLYKEGSTEDIAVEFTTDKEDGSGKVKMDEAAIKVSDKPVVENGTYILEVPKGYFIDSNGREVDAVTLKYVVENDIVTAVDNITAADAWVVYTLAGVKVLETRNAADLNTLARGAYIINGAKVFIK